MSRKIHVDAQAVYHDHNVMIKSREVADVNVYFLGILTASLFRFMRIFAFMAQKVRAKNLKIITARMSTTP